MNVILTVWGAVFVAGMSYLLADAILRARRARAHQRKLDARGADEDAPATLHPVIDPDTCMGSGACVRACPEKHALVLVNGRAHLADAAGCVGHGACRGACPVDAITLVFGSARRGVDLPELGPTFETNVKGLYVGGELGGMGLVSNAVRQGVKAVEAIAASLRAEGESRDPGVVTLVIVGAGPAGIGAALAARERGIAVRTLEREADVGGSVRTYARGKIVMTTPVVLPIYGRVRLRRTTKEALIELWNDVVARSGVSIEFGVTVSHVERRDGLFLLKTSNGEIPARRVLLAAGRRGKPRSIGAPGDRLPHVLDRLDDPAEHASVPCVVVGGGDSAIEAALALAEQPGARVALVHRRRTFERAKVANRERLEAAERRHDLVVAREAHVTAIDESSVHIEHADGSPGTLPARWVFALIGRELPLDLLTRSGIRVQTHYGEAGAVPAGGD